MTIGSGKKCKKCKAYLHYAQTHGIRLYTEENGKKYYSRYCPVCCEYSKEVKK